MADNAIGRLVEDLILTGGLDTSFIQWVPYDGIGRGVPSPRRTYSRATYLEWLCRIYCEAKALGEPRLLSAGEFDAVAGAVTAYGQPASKS